MIAALVVSPVVARESPARRPATVHFTLEDDAGLRPVVLATINGRATRMVLHANAGFSVQLNHAAADRIGVKLDRHAGSFGIRAVGRVAAIGRDEGVVDSVAVGGNAIYRMPASVFETPGDQSTGMLGLGWIEKTGVIVDFGRRTLTIDPSSADRGAVRRRLLALGYASVPMRRDGRSGRYLVTVGIGGETRDMDVSTVAALNLDVRFARASGVKLGRTIARYGGPGGATGAVRSTAAPVHIVLGGWRSQPLADVHVEDVYAYMGRPRPERGAIGGQLGAVFMIASGAVIDFGGRTLYLSRSSPAGHGDFRATVKRPGRAAR